jgi:lipopolysaccharide/colanic/teichoic acid biosynthesis glycosyltransferase
MQRVSHVLGSSTARVNAFARTGRPTERPVLSSGSKRALDLALAAFGLVVLAPLFLLIAAAIALDSGWPPLFAQERVGLRGSRFRMWKFRTMTQDAEARREPLAFRNEAPFPMFKVRRDPRITRVGRLVRRSSLDELPQLWNVLRGEMSLVGPRPPLPSEVLHYDDVARQRLDARPGLTCTWQIERRRGKDISFDEWVRLDLGYLEHWSLLGDVRLIFRTIAVIGRMNGE